MSEMKHTATSDEDTMTEVARRDLEEQGSKPRRKRGKNKNSRVTSIKVHPDVWAAAKRVLRDGERIQIVDENTVVTTYDIDRSSK